MGAVGSCLKPRATKYGSIAAVPKRRHVSAEELARPTHKRIVSNDHNRSFTTVHADRGEGSLSDTKLSERSEPEHSRYRVIVTADDDDGGGADCELFERTSDKDAVDVQIEDVHSDDATSRVDPLAISVEIPGVFDADAPPGVVEQIMAVEMGEEESPVSVAESSRIGKRSVVLTKAAMYDYRDAEARLDDEELVKAGLTPRDVLPPRPDELIDQPISDVSSLSSTVGRQMIARQTEE